MAHLIAPVKKTDHTQGPLDAHLTLVEYGDYECPYCGMAYPIVKQIQQELEDSLLFAFRNFPLKQVHPFALIAAEAAEAAGLQKKFWEMHDMIYENQAALSPEALLEFATQLKLDLNKFKADISSTKVKSKIDEDFQTGIRSGVNGTPCFFINGERFEGPISYQGLMQALSHRVG